MNSETKECPMCGETILAVAKKCKHCLEYLEINNESSSSNELTKSKIRDVYSKLKNNASRLININKTNNIYKFIKENENVTVDEIKKSFHVHLPDLEKLLNDLIKSSFIYKYDYGDKVVYTTKGISKYVDDRIKNSLSRLPEYDANYEMYKFIEKHGIATLKDIKYFSVNHLEVKEKYVEKILDDLIDLGLIFININTQDLGKTTYSTKKVRQKYKSEMDTSEKISNANKKQGKTQKSSTEEDKNDIEVDSHEIRKYLNKTLWPVLPENISGKETNDEGDHEESSDDIKTNLPDEHDLGFDLDKFMSIGHIIIVCPICKQKLRIPKNENLKVTCSICKTCFHYPNEDESNRN